MTLRAPDPPLGDGIVSLRPPDERDLEVIEQGIHDPDVIRWFGRPTATAAEVLARNRQRWRDGSPTFAVCEVGGPCVGHVWMNASPRDPDTGSVGYWLLPAARGRGLATRAVRLLVPWAIRALRLRQVRLVTESTNERSQRLAERSGFAMSGSEPGRSELDGQVVEMIVFAWSPVDVTGA